ncbi:hypothetical protein [Arthrobacter sp. H14]|uniref:hypothetical protein n=1 Tax=Arthrobacter sp. H14 TaxID=1312959 RepID=UPI00047E8C52|nr:hypothetical protein [Arthrobacter sp. H14]
MNPWSARLLHFALAVDAGDRVVVLGHADEAVLKSLQGAKVQVVKAELNAEPSPGTPADYAIVPALYSVAPEVACPRLSQWVRSGGGVLVLVPNAAHISKVLRRKGRRNLGWTHAGGRQELERNGFGNVEVYGVPNNIAFPRTLVPLNHPAALDWYAGSTYQPKSLKGKLMIRLIEKLPQAWQRKVLFPTLAFVAQRAPIAERTPC